MAGGESGVVATDNEVVSLSIGILARFMWRLQLDPGTFLYYSYCLQLQEIMRAMNIA